MMYPFSYIGSHQFIYPFFLGNKVCSTKRNFKAIIPMSWERYSTHSKISNILINHLILNRRNQVNFKSNNFNKEQGEKINKDLFRVVTTSKGLRRDLNLTDLYIQRPIELLRFQIKALNLISLV